MSLDGPHGPDGGYEHVELSSRNVQWVDTQWIADWSDPGDPHTWQEELRVLWRVDRDRLVALIADISSRGIQHPVRLAPDADSSNTWRVVDGHHRIAAAFALRIEVPCVFVNL